MSLPAVVLWAATVAASGAWPEDQPGHPYHREQHERAPAEMWMVVEVPLGSAVKYELDKATGHLFVDRFQSMPVVAPANYGSFPRTLAPDGDPLDAVMLSRHPVHPGAFVRVRPVAAIRTVDGPHRDDKVLVVPVGDVDPTFDGVLDVKDIPEAERKRIAAYFQLYKKLPAGLDGRILETVGREAADAIIREAMEAYRRPSRRR